INQMSITEFILLGFGNVPEFQILLFLLFLVIYIMTMAGNILIAAIVVADHHLHTPMCFFLENLSFLETCYTSTILPRMLASVLTGDITISVNGCFMQLYCFGVLACSECYLLAAMSYDRYLAICKPLHYVLIMNRRVCLSLVVLSWFSGNMVSLVQTAWVFTLPFCGSNQINYFFCDILSLIKLSCTDISSYEMQLFTVTMLVNFTPFSLILVSYIIIISTILKMALADGRYKASSTSSSHLIVVTLYYGSSGLIYLRPKSINSPDSNKVLALMYTTITPILNPIVYSLRNNEVKGAVQRLLWDRLKGKIFSQIK
uniref:Olfactory receptor n=1 Tax=Gopherus evgoodei TaxID=1825980 RepID=A0A8C4WF86_9SAUR